MMSASLMLFGMVAAGINDGLLMDCPLQGDVVDHSGNGNDLTEVNGMVTANGFEATNSAYLTRNGLIDFASSDAITMSIAYRLTAHNDWDGLFSMNAGGIRYRMLVHPGLQHVMTNAGQHSDVNSPHTTVIGTWYHMTMTISGGVAKIYMNGVLVRSYATITMLPNVDTVYVGRGEGTNTHNTEGRLSHARLYNRAVSDAEAMTLCELSGVCAPTCTQGPSGVAFDSAPVGGASSLVVGALSLSSIAASYGAATVYVPSVLPVAPATTISLSCCGAVDCEFFVSVYHCAGCSAGINGGFPSLLPPLPGWSPTSCAPKFDGNQPMVSFHTVVPAGQTVALPASTLPTSHMAIFGVEGSFPTPWCTQNVGPQQNINMCATHCAM